MALFIVLLVIEIIAIVVLSSDENYVSTFHSAIISFLFFIIALCDVVLLWNLFDYKEKPQ